ncbi:copper fist DNA binding domain-containing protein [Sporodiniella umbellata]|nr:copper fist DNA binding domain-containing protein [Sporodiniella umbellata]
MYINGLKYACSTCIKGHRSSSCSHVDRPLFEIRKKGRPASQCKHCKGKTKQTPIQCACKKDSPQPLLMCHNQSEILNPACLAHIDKNHPCICPTNHPTHFASSTNVSQEFARESLMSAPLCNTPMVKQENWTPQTAEAALSKDQHDPRYRTSSKPTNASRILDGQPRVHRRSPKTSPTPPTTYAMTPTPPMPYLPNFPQEELAANFSHCGSFMPSNRCFPPNIGESAVITITPLNQDSFPTTRIVTCYCGNQCTCPGCLVHPQLGDPSTSSSCNGSDDDMSIYSHFF